jgi:hypothetical protein
VAPGAGNERSRKLLRCFGRDKIAPEKLKGLIHIQIDKIQTVKNL